MNIILTIDGKCAFCHAKGEHINTEDVYGWRHKEPACDLFKGALKQAANVKPLTNGIGWEITNDD